MSEAVDTRIVEAKFDSSQFEKGVDRTVKKLDELKNSLNMENTGKSIAQLADKTKDATEKASSALEKIENRITSFAGMIKQKLLSGIADEIVGVFFKIKNGFESLVHTLSSAQVSHGMQRYVDIMGSVRTLVFSGVKQDVAYETIGRLGTYADQTSYSLDQLVSTMSKFKTAGANLNTAERMVIGLSNAAASMGVNANDAARAYLNLQQAYSKGSMMQNDWISFESLPMVGEKFNQAILDAAVKVGTLEKQTNGTYKTLNKIDKQVKTSGADSKGITAQNLGTKLSSRWFNKKVMEEVFGGTYFFNITDIVDEEGNTQRSSEVISDIKEYERAAQAAATDIKAEKEKLQNELKAGVITQDQYAEKLSDIVANRTYDNLSTEFKENSPKVDYKKIKESIGTYLKENGFDKVDYEDIYTKNFELYLDTIEQRMLDQKRRELQKQVDDGKLTIEEYNKALKDFETNNNLTRFGWEALRAGQEARSFNDVLNTLKDTISRGWSTSFEYIFGRLDEAAKFFTWLTENELANAIYNIGEFRNAVLGTWSNTGGRDDLIEALENIDNLIGRILGKFVLFSDPDSNEFKTTTQNMGMQLSKASFEFKLFTERLDAWFTEERVDRIHNIFGTVGNLLGTFFRVLGLAFNFAKNAFELFEPLLGTIIDNVNKVVTRLNLIFNAGDNSETKDGIDTIEQGLNNILIAIEPIIKPLQIITDFLGEVGVFFVDLSAGTFVSNLEFIADTLGFIIELFGGASAQRGSAFKDKQKEIEDVRNQIEKLNEDYKEGKISEEDYNLAIAKYNKTLKNYEAQLKRIDENSGVIAGIKKSLIDLGNAFASTFSFATGFFSALYDDLRVLLGLKQPEAGEEGGYFSNLKKYFSTSEFLSSIGKWFEELPTKISELSNKIWNNINRFIFGTKRFKVEKDEAGNRSLVAYYEGGFVNIIKNIFSEVSSWVEREIPAIASSVWNAVNRFIFGTKRFKVEKDEAGNRSLVAYYEGGLINSIKDIFNKVKKWITSDLPTIASSVWSTISRFIFGTKKFKVVKNEKGERSLVAYFEGGIINPIKDWIKNELPNKIKEIWKTIDEFIFGRKVEVINKDHNNPNNTIRVKEGFSAWLEQAITDVESWITSIPEKISNLWNTVIDFIFYRDPNPDEVNPETGDKYGPNDRVKNGFLRWIESIPSKIGTWFTVDLPRIIKNIWNAVIDFIFGKPVDPDEINPETGETYGPNVRIKQGFSKWLDDAVHTVSDWVSGVPEKIKSIWDTVLGAIFNPGESDIEKQKPKKFDQTYYDYLLEVDPSGYGATMYKREMQQSSNSIIQTVKNFVDGLGIDIGAIISGLPASIINNINFGVDMLGILLENVTKWLSNKNEGETVSDAIAKGIEEDNAEESPILNALLTFGNNVKTLITKTIPGFLTEGFTWIQNNGANIWTAFRGIFVGDKTDEEIAKSIEAFGLKIQKKIEDIPRYVRLGIEAVKKLLSKDDNTFNRSTFMENLQRDLLGERLNNFENLRKGMQKGTNVTKSVFHEGVTDLEKDLKEESEGFNFLGLVGSIGNTILDVFSELGPYVIEGLNKLVEFIGNGFTWVTSFLDNRDKNEPLTDSLSKAVGADETLGKQSAFGIAISKLGSSIGTLITDILPKFIRSAIDEVSVQVPKMLEKLANLFSGEGIDGLTGGESGTNENSTDIDENIQKDVNSELEKAKVEKERLARIAKIQSAIKDLEDELVNVTTAHQIPTVEDETRRKEINASISEYEAILYKLEHFEGTTMLELDESSKNATGAVEGQENFFSSLLNMFSTIGTSKTTMLAIIVVSISSLIDSLTSTVQASDELAAAAKLAKWHAMEMAIAGIIGVLAWVFTLASMDDSTKYERVKTVLTDFSDLVLRITELVTGAMNVKNISGAAKEGFSFLGDLSETVRAFKGDANAVADAVTDISTTKKVADKAVAVATKVSAPVLAGTAASAILDVLGEGVAGFFDGLAEAFGLIGSAADSFMTLITPVINKLNEINGSVDTAIDVAGKLGTLLKTFYDAIKEVELDPAKELPPEYRKTGYAFDSHKVRDAKAALTEQFDASLDFIGIVLDLTSKLANAVKTFSEVDDPLKSMSDLNKIITDETSGFGTLMDSLKTAFNSFVSRATEADLPKNLDDKKTTAYFSAIGSFFNMFAAAVSSYNFNFESITAVKMALEAISGFAEEIGDSATMSVEFGVVSSLFIKNIDLGRLGRLISIFGTNIKTFFVSMDEIRKLVGAGDAENDLTTAFETVIRLVNMALHGIAETMRVVNSSDSFWDLLNHLLGDNENKFSSLIKSYGEGASSLFVSLHDLKTKKGIEFNKDDMNFFLDSIAAFKGVIESLDILGNIGNSWLNGDSQAVGFGVLQTKLHNLFTYTIGGKAFQDDLPSVDSKGKKYQGLIGYFEDFFKDLDKMATGVAGTYSQEMASVAFKRIQVVISSITATTNMFKDLADPTASFDNLEKNVNDYVRLMDTFINSKDKFAEFFTMTKEFDSEGLTNASIFASMLNNLSQTLNMFSDFAPDKNLDGDGYKSWAHLVGLDNLLALDWADIKNVASNMFGIFDDINFTAYYDTGYTVGENIDKGIANGLEKGLAAAAAQTLATQLSKSFTITLQMHSPSKLFELYGKYIDEGLALGIDRNSGAPVDATSSVIDDLNAEFTADNGLFNNLRSGISNIFGLITNFSNSEDGLFGNILAKASDFLGASKDLSNNTADISPKVTPVLELTDDFKAGMDSIGQFFGIGGNPLTANGEAIFPTNISADLANQIDIPVPIDYSSHLQNVLDKLETVNENVSQFNYSLMNIRFIIQGAQFADTIGPDIDEYLGREGVYVARRSTI